MLIVRVDCADDSVINSLAILAQVRAGRIFIGKMASALDSEAQRANDRAAQYVEASREPSENRNLDNWKRGFQSGRPGAIFEKI